MACPPRPPPSPWSPRQANWNKIALIWKLRPYIKKNIIYNSLVQSSWDFKIQFLVCDPWQNYWGNFSEICMDNYWAKTFTDNKSTPQLFCFGRQNTKKLASFHIWFSHLVFAQNSTSSKTNNWFSSVGTQNMLEFANFHSKICSQMAWLSTVDKASPRWH